MNIISFCAVSVVVLMLSGSLKHFSKPYYIVLLVASAVILASFVLSSASPLFQKIQSLLSASNISFENSAILFKSLGICWITQFTSDACKDAGESSLANKIELAGKIAIITTVLPIFDHIITYSAKIMGAN